MSLVLFCWESNARVEGSTNPCGLDEILRGKGKTTKRVECKNENVTRTRELINVEIDKLKQLEELVKE